MRGITSGHWPARQRGAALLILLALFATAAAYMLVNSLNKGNAALTLARSEKNRAVMQEAKVALIAWAASETLQGANFQPGRLPCPDRDNDGNADSTCTTVAARLGRLPYKTLGIAELRDVSGELLWYAVSENFRTGTSVINSNTQGTLTISGLVPANNTVAVVFSPGMRLGAQDRSPDETTCKANLNSNQPCNTATNYLEGKNSDAIADDYVSATENLTDPVVANLFNDQLLAITHQDLFSIVEPVVAARIERDIKPDLVTYFTQWTNAFPYPAKFANPAPDPWPGPGPLPGPGTSATRTQSQYIGDTTISNGEGLLPITATVTYPWTSGSGAVTLTGGTAGSISGISCAAVLSPFSGWQCSFTIDSIDLGSNSSNWGPCTDINNIKYQYCMVNPSFSVRGDIGANAGISFPKLPNSTEVKVTSAGGSARAMASTTISGTLSLTGVGTVIFQGTNSPYSKYNSSSFTRSMRVTIPDVLVSPVTSTTDLTAGWFITNEWYRVTYYVVSSGYLPGAAGSCNSTSPKCLTVNNLSTTPNNDKRAILILAGRSLNGSARPSSTLTDYLEAQNSSTSDGIFEHGLGKTTTVPGPPVAINAINDRVIVIAP